MVEKYDPYKVYAPANRPALRSASPSMIFKDSDENIRVVVRIRNAEKSGRVKTPNPSPSPSPLPPINAKSKQASKPGSASSKLNVSNSDEAVCLSTIGDSSVNIVDPTTKKSPAKTFNYDAVFDMDTDQSQLYNGCIQSLIERSLEGYNACIFAYGQTASGKTYTMQGPNLNLDSEAEHGIIYRVANQVASYVKSKQGKKDSKGFVTDVVVKVSFIEIYNESLADLLVPKNAESGT
jgi:hypothetical protein